MGALIQTKGTQRLAELFNSRFSDLSVAGIWRSTGTSGTYSGLLSDAFDKAQRNLLFISDSFIVQNMPDVTANPTRWPTDRNDVLYPSATLSAVAVTVGPPSQITFNLPVGFVPPFPAEFMVANNSYVANLDKRNTIDLDTQVNGAPVTGAPGGGPGGTTTLTVTLSKPMINAVRVGDKISFIKGKHQRLVRRWRWYLQHDLKAANDTAIKNALAAAFDDLDFTSITFATVEDTQSVLTNVEQRLDTTTFELTNKFIMHVVLLTQKTTAPDQQD